MQSRIWFRHRLKDDMPCVYVDCSWENGNRDQFYVYFGSETDAESFVTKYTKATKNKEVAYHLNDVLTVLREYENWTGSSFEKDIQKYFYWITEEQRNHPIVNVQDAVSFDNMPALVKGKLVITLSLSNDSEDDDEDIQDCFDWIIEEKPNNPC